MNDLKVYLATHYFEMRNIWREEFLDIPEVGIIYDYISDINDIDCIVCTSDSIGYMSGSWNTCVKNLIGEETVSDIKKEIDTRYNGDQPLGTCIVKECEIQNKFKYIAHSPIRRFKETGHQNDTCVYSSFKSVINTIKEQNLPISSVVFPPSGLWTNKIKPKEISKQMHQAYQELF